MGKEVVQGIGVGLVLVVIVVTIGSLVAQNLSKSHAAADEVHSNAPSEAHADSEPDKAGAGAAATREDPKPGAVPEAAMKQARDVFSQRCTPCHGESGGGDGIAAASLDPKPRNFKDTGWQKSVEDTRIQKVIVEGGGSVDLSPLMAPNPDLKEQPKVLDGLVALIRGFGSSD